MQYKGFYFTRKYNQWYCNQLKGSFYTKGEARLYIDTKINKAVAKIEKEIEYLKSFDTDSALYQIRILKNRIQDIKEGYIKL